VVKLLDNIVGLIAEITIWANLQTFLGLSAVASLNAAANF
jgi:hypothetical protein